MKTEEDAGRPVRGVVLPRRELVAKPERDPRAIGSLGGCQEPHSSNGCGSDVSHQNQIEVRAPGAPRLERVSRDLGGAPVEGKGAPPAAERRYAAVPVLHPQQPADTCRS